MNSSLWPANRWTARFTLCGLLAATTLLRLRLLSVPLERDEGEYAYMAQLILHGEIPYVAAQNMKLPGVYYGYAGILALFGETDVAIRLGLLAINLAAIAFLYFLGRRLFDASTGLGAAVAYATFSLSQGVLGFTANTEHFVVVPMLGGALLLAGLGPTGRMARVACAGALLGLAVLMKQHAAAFVLFGGVYVFLHALRRDGTSPRAVATECLVFAAAALAPFGLTCAGMAAAGAFEPFWFWTVTYAREYATMTPLGLGLPKLGSELTRIAGYTTAFWVLAAVGLSALVWDQHVRRRARFMVPFLLCSCLAVSPGLRFSEHYFILLLPAASLLAGAAAASLARRLAPRPPARAFSISLGLSLAAALLSVAQERSYLFSLSPAAISRSNYGANPFPEAVEIARYLRQHSDEGDRVAVIGSEPQIYFYARRHAATTYLYTYPLMEAQPFARRMQEEMIAQIERERPRFLVLVNVDSSWLRRPDSSPKLFEWAEQTVNRDYEIVGLAEIEPGGQTSYRWGDDARDAQPRSPSFVLTARRRS